jgi:hypothetical protein
MVLYSWAKPENHYLTDELLGLIEDSPTWKVALGFDKGTDLPVATGGKKNVAHCLDIAKRLFTRGEGPWDNIDDPALANVIKNRIMV